MDDPRIKPCSILLHKVDAKLGILQQFQHTTVSSSTPLSKNPINSAVTKNEGVTYELNKMKETTPDKKLFGRREAAEDFLEIIYGKRKMHTDTANVNVKSIALKNKLDVDTATMSIKKKCKKNGIYSRLAIQNGGVKCDGNRDIADLHLRAGKKITNKKISSPSLPETQMPSTRNTPSPNKKNVPACILCSMPGGNHVSGCLELLDLKSFLSVDPKTKLNRNVYKPKCQNSYSGCKVSKNKNHIHTQHVGHKCSSQNIKINSFSLECCNATRCSDIKNITKTSISNGNFTNTANISTNVDPMKSISSNNGKYFYMDIRKQSIFLQNATFEFDKKVQLCFMDIVTKCNYAQKNENSETLSCLRRKMSGICDELQKCTADTTDAIDQMIFTAGFADHASTATQAEIISSPATSTTKMYCSGTKKKNAKSNIVVKNKQNVMSFSNNKLASETDLNVAEQRQVIRKFRNKSAPVFIPAPSSIAIDGEACSREHNDTSLHEVHSAEPNFVQGKTLKDSPIASDPKLFSVRDEHACCGIGSDRIQMVKCEPDIYVNMT